MSMAESCTNGVRLEEFDGAQKNPKIFKRMKCALYDASMKVSEETCCIRLLQVWLVVNDPSRQLHVQS